MDPGNYHASLPALVQNLEKVSAIQKIWLFGSRARGDHQPRSDIDLAIEAPGLTPQEWALIGDTVEQCQTLLKIDLVDLAQAPTALRENVFKEGICLYERP